MIEVAHTDQYVRNDETRMPFRFGNVVVRGIAHHFLDLELSIDGERAEGISMAGIAPAWFLKDPDRSLPDRTALLIEAFEAACEHARRLGPRPTAFDLWQALYGRQREWAEGQEHPPLLWNYGVAMVEQAVIDAVCRHEGLPFAEGIRSGAFGVEPGRIYDELEGERVGEYLPAEPTGEAAVRHTVGLSDPLREADIEPEGRLDDGLPQSLEAYIERDGVDHFKIKLSADPERDAERLARIVDVLEGSSLDSWLCTVDANEGYESVAAFEEQWERHAADPALSPVMEAVAYVEQPLARGEALSESTREVLTAWQDRPPIIIDESDARLDSAGRALACGYAGTSHKNCKGVFKGVINSCLVEKRRREDDGREYVMSGEDLTTVGPVELLADLAVMGSLGMEHIERNGHHYYRGLDFLPADIQETVREAHGDLYRRHADGFVALAIEDGRMTFDSVVEAPFGRDFELDPARFTPLDEWAVGSMYE